VNRILARTWGMGGFFHETTLYSALQTLPLHSNAQARNEQAQARKCDFSKCSKCRECRYDSSRPSDEQAHNEQAQTRTCDFRECSKCRDCRYDSSRPSDEQAQHEQAQTRKCDYRRCSKCRDCRCLTMLDLYNANRFREGRDCWRKLKGSGGNCKVEMLVLRWVAMPGT